MTEPLLRISDLHVTARAKNGERVLVDGVSLQILKGEALGLVGESGSGKSLTARSIIRLLPAPLVASGTITFDGQHVLTMKSSELRRYRSTRVAMIFQDPRAHVNPVRTIGDFLTEALVRLRGVPRGQADHIAIGLLSDVGIPDGPRRLRQYPHELSGGLLQRAMIASALAVEPDLILADEPTTALDVTTQSEVMAILDELRRERGMAMLFITHDLELAAATCDRTAVMYAGAIVEEQLSRSLQEDPHHPYTSGLLVSRPSIDTAVEHLPAIPGLPIAAFQAGPGCAFEPRCAYANAECATTRPLLSAYGLGRVACLRADELEHLPNGAEEPMVHG